MFDGLFGSTAVNLVFAAAAAGGLAIAFFVANLATARASRIERDLIVAHGRLPAAARLEHVDHVLRERERELDDLDGRLGRVRQEMAEAERAKLDAEQWRDLAEQAKRDYDALSEEQREVDRVRAEHERALVDLGQARGDLETARRERTSLLDEVQTLSDQLRALEDKHHEFTELDAKIEQRQAAIEALRAQLAQMQDHRDELAAAKFELDESHRRLAVLEERRAHIIEDTDVLAERRKTIDAELRPLQSTRDELSREIEELSHTLDDLGARRNGLEANAGSLTERVAALEERRARITDDVDQLAERRKFLEAELRPLDELRGTRDRLAREIEERTHTVEDLGARRSSLEATVSSLAEREAALREAIEDLKGETHAGGIGPAHMVDRAEVVADLKRPPAALFENQGSPLLARRQSSRDQQAALDRVQHHLSLLGLEFDARTVKRFHTCLKTARISPLTVLAGISGTGKSQLPQRYAEAIGMHFLKIPVQPRWDSPQDLFGFYNYLEQKFRATELARALVYMDPLGNNLIEQKESKRDHMLLVLLDEMNLARIEYYFSEFLSRLEGRPAPGVESEERVRPSRIEIELGIAELGRRSVYPGHNVLFAGTMNEDEFTQSLSDKVLDRANVIRFSRPKQLLAGLKDQGGKFTDEYLPFETWTSWYVPVEDISRDSFNLAERFISDLNEQLGQLRRPFGHRINQAILSYVANHPDAGSPAGSRSALSDMLELRVLPKLRGIENEDRFMPAFQRIGELVRNQLGDAPLADTINAAATQSDTFDWIAPA